MACNSSAMGNVGASRVDFHAEMTAFDTLPFEMREIIRNAPIQVGAGPAAKAIQAMGEKRAIDIMVASLSTRMPTMTAAAWGPEHPALKR